MECDWNKPGHNPYRGTVAEAVARYNLPKNAQYEIIEKARQVRPDATLTISRDGALSTTGDQFSLTNMHFGKGSVCKGEVRRNTWADTHREIALVYCSGEHCIAVPIICHNVTLLRPVEGLRDVPRISDTDWLLHRGVPAPEPKATPTVHTVPEPSTYALFGIGALALVLTRRTARKSLE